MASVQEPCVIYVYAQSPSEQRKLLYQARVEYLGLGGSADGAIAVATDLEKWATIPLSPVLLHGGTKIIIAVKLDAADGIDVSDCATHLPIFTHGSGMRHLGRADLGITTDLPAATLAALQVDLGAGYEVPRNAVVQFGGGKAFMSIEDDTG